MGHVTEQLKKKKKDKLESGKNKWYKWTISGE